MSRFISNARNVFNTNNFNIPDPLIVDTFTANSITTAGIVNSGTWQDGSNHTFTFPSSSQTMVGRTTTDTLTNKTLTTPTINGASLSGNLSGNPIFTGSSPQIQTGVLLLNGGGLSPTLTLTADSLGGLSRNVHFPNPGGDDNFCYLAASQALTNKTISFTNPDKAAGSTVEVLNDAFTYSHSITMISGQNGGSND